MSGSQWALLAAMPIKAQFVMTATTLSVSNAALKKKKKKKEHKQPIKKYVRNDRVTFSLSRADFGKLE